MEWSTEHLIWAVALGGLSALSLPLGSLLGLSWRPASKVLAAFTAFGAGALISALALELVAPTAETLIAARHGGGDAHEVAEATEALLFLVLGSVVGGLLFVTLDQLVNQKGGFLRKTATTMAFLGQRRARQQTRILGKLGTIQLLREVPEELLQQLVSSVRPVHFSSGETLFHEGDTGDSVYFLVQGHCTVEQRGRQVSTLSEGDVLGEIALLIGAPRTATVRADDAVEALRLGEADFARLREQSPELDQATVALATERLGESSRMHEADAMAVAAWADRAARALEQGDVVPTTRQLRLVREEHSGAPMAIWLGILLDGIPESFVIGSSLVGMLAARAVGADGVTFVEVIPWTLIAGLFLSNFPEAMSSSIGMRAQGWGRSRVFFMWFSLMVVTAAGAGFGYWLGGGAPHWALVGIEGVAAGAMLTMIASAMLPEAIHLGGSSVTGLSTLAGFLAALSFKLLE